jgi:N-sulfoglucosamine sulfohydrolase
MPNLSRRLSSTAGVIAAAVLLAGSIATPGLAAPPPAARPNIVWISAEDLSPDLHAYGDPYAVTPVLDRLAAEGARYTSAFAVAPVCAPSRSSIITGVHPTSIGTMHMRSKGVPPPGVKAFTEYLRAAGYYTTNQAKTDYNVEAPPANRPPDSVWDDTGNRAHWRNRPDPAQPFFSVFNINTTHESQIRLDPAQFANVTARVTAEARHDPAKAVLPPYYPDTPVVRADWARYYDLITAMDREVGDILKQLEDDGLADRTIVFFWGDHGRGLPRGKRWVYDSGIQVPLIVRWPGGLRGGTVVDDLVTLMDLGPTVLSLAGVPVPAHMHGRAFLGAGRAAPREYVFAHRDRMDEAYDTIRAVRDTRYKYIRNAFPGRPYAQHIAYMEEMPTMQEWRRLYKDHMNALSPEFGRALNATQLLFFQPEKPPEELYDLQQDPHEVHNLAGTPANAAVLERMRRTLDAWQRETGDLGLVPELELRERMRPGGVWQTVAAPTLTVARTGSGSATLTFASSTPGASFVYATGDAEPVRWKLAAGAVELPVPARVRVKACRMGFLDSPIVERDFR